MARLARLCVPGWPHVLVQRGHNRQAVFVDDTDRQLFRNLLQEAALHSSVQIHAYGLLDDEVRLLATPASAQGLSVLMQAIGRRYVANFNRRHSRHGGLWEGRFRCTVVEPEQHLLACMQYVEFNAGDALADWSLSPWTSTAHHLGARMDRWITDPAQFWSLGNTPFEREAAYQKLVMQGLTDAQQLEISLAVNSGWPLGSEAFVSLLESATPRRLTPRSRGRPRTRRESDPNN
jgi:putative transposase